MRDRRAFPEQYQMWIHPCSWHLAGLTVVTLHGICSIYYPSNMLWVLNVSGLTVPVVTPALDDNRVYDAEMDRGLRENLAIASGKPLTPSTQAIRISSTLPFWRFVNTSSQKLAPSLLDMYMGKSAVAITVCVWLFLSLMSVPACTYDRCGGCQNRVRPFQMTVYFSLQSPVQRFSNSDVNTPSLPDSGIPAFNFSMACALNPSKSNELFIKSVSVKLIISLLDTH